MKLYKKLTLLLAVLLIANVGNAQTKKQSKEQLEHKLIVGYNFGATFPMPIPNEVQKITAYWPIFSPQLGYSLTYNMNDQWALKTGAIFEIKGMGVTNKVKYMKANVVMDDNTISGYFVGRNQTTAKISYLTIPIKVAYSFNDKWSVNGGGYFSYRSSSEFSGTVWDGYLRKTDNDDIINSDKIEIKDKWDAEFDFGSEMRDIDLGLNLGAEYKLNNKFGLYGDVTYGLTSVFPSSFTSLQYNDMRNLYVALGITYRL